MLALLLPKDTFSRTMGKAIVNLRTTVLKVVYTNCIPRICITDYTDFQNWSKERSSPTQDADIWRRLETGTSSMATLQQSMMSPSYSTDTTRPSHAVSIGPGRHRLDARHRYFIKDALSHALDILTGRLRSTVSCQEYRRFFLIRLAETSHLHIS